MRTSGTTGLDRLRALLARHPESAAYAAATAGAAAGLWSLGALDRGWLGWVLLALVALACWRLARTAEVERALRGPGLDPGVVEVAERRVIYFGPEGGGTISLDDLRRVELIADGAQGDRVWLLDAGAPEERLRIPAGARGAEALIAALGGLQGFDPARALDLSAGGGWRRVEIWRRP